MKRSALSHPLLYSFLFSALLIIPTVILLGKYVASTGDRQPKNLEALRRHVPQGARLQPEQIMRRMRVYFDRALEVWIVDAGGNVLENTGRRPLPYRWEELPHPETAWGMRPFLGEKIEIGPIIVTRLETDPPKYAVFAQVTRPRIPYFAKVAAILAFAIGVSVLVSGVSILLYLRRKARLATVVLAQLQSGNLGARLPVGPGDELGRLILRFNNMAEEIERLVGQLRTVESSRVAFLQELAHDLRTPLTSLRNLLENLSDDQSALTPAERAECVQLALEETDYFQRLIEDLFFLAQMNVPNYRLQAEKISLEDLLEAERTRTELNAQQENRSLSCVLRIDEGGHPFVSGDPHLLKRLFRNLLTNAARFARARIEIEVRRAGDSALQIAVRDDGPGFPEAALRHFGERRSTRVLTSPVGGKTSLGLGSVIARSIALRHRGNVEAANWTGPGGEIAGARLVVTLPLHSWEPAIRTAA